MYRAHWGHIASHAALSKHETKLGVVMVVGQGEGEGNHNNIVSLNC